MPQGQSIFHGPTTLKPTHTPEAKPAHPGTFWKRRCSGLARHNHDRPTCICPSGGSAWSSGPTAPGASRGSCWQHEKRLGMTKPFSSKTLSIGTSPALSMCNKSTTNTRPWSSSQPRWFPPEGVRRHFDDSTSTLCRPFVDAESHFIDTRPTSSRHASDS